MAKQTSKQFDTSNNVLVEFSSKSAFTREDVKTKAVIDYQNLNVNAPNPGDELRSDLQMQNEYCRLAAIFVASHFQVPITQLMSKTRAKAQVAKARQVAIYVAHTTFSVPYREAAAYFHRDRTTIAHACKTIEDRRDDHKFDARVSLIENLVEEAAGINDDCECDFASDLSNQYSSGS